MPRGTGQIRLLADPGRQGIRPAEPDRRHGATGQKKFGFGWEALENRCGTEASVPDEAAVRIDFAAWLEGLSQSRRRVVEALLEGLTNSEVAARLGVSETNVQHLRRKCLKDWNLRHGEP